MDDLTEAKILLTGATDGLGRRVALELAGRGATVLLHGRSRERLEATVEEVRRETDSEKVGSDLADLSSLGEVRALAEEVRWRASLAATSTGRARRARMRRPTTRRPGRGCGTWARTSAGTGVPETGEE